MINLDLLLAYLNCLFSGASVGAALFMLRHIVGAYPKATKKKTKNYLWGMGASLCLIVGGGLYSIAAFMTESTIKIICADQLLVNGGMALWFPLTSILFGAILLEILKKLETTT